MSAVAQDERPVGGGGFEDTNALSVLATAGEMDIALSQSPTYNKAKTSYPVTQRVWAEQNSRGYSAVPTSPRQHLSKLETQADNDSIGQSRSASAGRSNSGAPSKSCNCKSTGCLKRYCDCFKAGEYCTNCSCQNCMNNESHHEEREKAINFTLGRDPNAFRPKISKNIEQEAKHSKGCHCKKTACLKGYCECFQAGVLCSELCKCNACKNFENSVDLINVRANQQDAGLVSGANEDAGADESYEPVSKRPRTDFAGASASQKAGVFDKTYGPGLMGSPSVVLTPILQRSSFATPEKTRSNLIGSREAVELLQGHCRHLIQIATEEYKLAVERRNLKGTNGDNGQNGSKESLDEDEDNVQLSIERALMEETAATLHAYRQKLL